MISATSSIKRPLPVRPIDGRPVAPGIAPNPVVRDPRLMQPMVQRPVEPVTGDLVDALRTAAYQRMLDRLGITDLGAVAEPSR